MGCVGSKGMPSIPGLTQTPCAQYAENRRKAIKDLVQAQETLLEAIKDSAEAMHGVGHSLKLFCATTNAFDNPSFNPLPPLVPLTQHSATVPPPEATGPLAGGTVPQPSAYGYPTGTPAAHQEYGDSVSAYPPAPQPQVPVPTAPPPASPPPLPQTNNMQIVSVVKHKEKKERLEELAKRIDALFTEMGQVMTKPIHDASKAGKTMARAAMPALTLENSKTPDGKLEPMGDSLHKVLLWENHLKEDVKVLESARSALNKSDKKLEKLSTKVARDPNADLRKMRESQSKVNDATAKLNSSTKAIEDTYLSIEQYKAEVLFPQYCRLFPLLSDNWSQVGSIFTQQHNIAMELASIELVAPVPPALNEDAALLTSTAPEIEGEATKANHEATKALEAAFVKWMKCHEANIASQKNAAQALHSWVKATMAIPGDFPRPSPEAMASVPTGPIGNVHQTFSTMSVDWERVLDHLPAVMREGMVAMSQSVRQAYEQQVKGQKEHKKLEASRKELAKAESKLAAAKKKELDVNKQVDDLKIDPTKEKELAKAIAHAKQATSDVSAAVGTLQGCQMKFKAEREAYARALFEECNAAGVALQGLSECFAKCVEFASAASNTLKVFYENTTRVQLPA